MFEKPHVAVLIPRLTSGSEQAQGGHRMFVHPLISSGLEDADCRWAYAQRVDLPFIDDLPHAFRCWKIWRTFEDDHGAAPEGYPDHFPRSHHPTDVCEPEENVILLNVEGKSEFARNRCQCTGMGMNRAFGLACCAGSIQIHRG